MAGEFDPLVKCPRCGASTLVDEEGHRWCAYIGGETDAPCSWGLDSLDRGSREADVAAWRKRRGIPDPAETRVLAACEEVGYGRVMQVVSDAWRAKDPIGAFAYGPCYGSLEPHGFGTPLDLLVAWERLTADLAETRLRLAIWSGEGVPEGWSAAADGVPSIERDLGDLTAEVYADGRWLIWRDLRDDLAPGVVVEDHPGPRPVLTACAEAEAWRREQEGGDAP